MMDLRNQILAAQDTRREAVAVPEWGIESGLFVRELSAKDRDAWEMGMVSIDAKRREVRQIKLANLRARLVVLTLVDETGQRVLTDDDVEALGGKSAGVVSRLFEVAQRINGLGEAEVKALEKNLEPSRDGVSSSS